MRLTLVFVAVLSLVFSGCGSVASEEPDASPQDLLGRSFVSTSVRVDEEPHELVGGSLAVRFEDSSDGVAVSWEAGCNVTGGLFKITADRIEPHLSPDGVPAFGGTEVGCEPHEHEQDEWLENAFAEGPRWTLDGDTLVLTMDAVEFTLEEGDWRRG